MPSSNLLVNGNPARRDWIGLIKRGVRKPPRAIARRIAAEIMSELERVTAPRRARNLDLAVLLAQFGANSISELWSWLAERPYVAWTKAMPSIAYARACPGDEQRILDSAALALKHHVKLLGSTLVDLGPNINWHQDFKTGFSWPVRYFRDIDYVNKGVPSDVKIPWELSRLQWLIPAGQAYALSGDEKYAECVKQVLLHWIDENPYAHGVNWTCTMEVALRILTWTWFFHIFKSSGAWSDTRYRYKFLASLFLHCDFTQRHLEQSDVNGNHYTADAAGLIFGGLFFGRGKRAEMWQRNGWTILCHEMPIQVLADGVDYEASVAYHRLVCELFLLPALYRQRLGLEVPVSYSDRLTSMARFVAAYSRSDGTVPLVGDADDARTLPFGGQHTNDHRYLVGLVGLVCANPQLLEIASGPKCEEVWLFGPERAAFVQIGANPRLVSQSFEFGGYYVMRNSLDHVFIDCGPVGLGGRGGHGHNDCLSFEAVILGTHLISDCGAYLYTASFEERNRFRSTSFHNTPQLDGQEINRFVHPDHLWNLRYDALPEVRRWSPGANADVFIGSHSGYRRLSSPVTPIRTIILNHQEHTLVVKDTFDGEGQHSIVIPLHFAPGVQVFRQRGCHLVLVAKSGVGFDLIWDSAGTYELDISPARISPTYGVTEVGTRAAWRVRGTLEPLQIRISPC